MLVLTRTAKAGKNTITLDGPAVITIEQVVGRNVRVGITAPPGTTIRRGELIRQRQQPKPHNPQPQETNKP